jgi:hypothetical protein
MLMGGLCRVAWKRDGPLSINCGRLPWDALRGHQFEEITIAADDGVGLSGHSERKSLVVIRIPGDARLRAGIFVPDGEFHQF